jgi:hypothetical protein
MDISMVDLHAPLSRVIDPARITEALERTRLVLLRKVVEEEDAQRQASTTLSKFYGVQGDAPVELVHDVRHGFATTNPGPSQRSPSASRGHGGMDRAVVL